MRAFEFLTEAETPAPKKVGREFNHLEDLVFTEPNGGKKAVELLKGIAQDAKEVSIKWDGNPTVYWGREEDGQFRMVGKNNWGREEGKSSSPEELKSFIMSRGKGEDWREKFANDMASLWPIFEAATPADFQGYVYGDILFHPGKPYQGGDGRISFTPNQTTYSVRGTSNIGRKLGKAKIAVAVHKHLDYFGDKSGAPISDVSVFNNTSDLVVFGQTYVSHQPAVNADNLGAIEKLVNTKSGAIDQFLAPVAGMGYLQDTIYTFVNNQSKTKQLENINSKAFFAWIGSNPTKLKKISEHSQRHPGVIDLVFQLVTELMKAKDEVIRELDAAKGDIEQHTGGKPGGEGYVYKDAKLVPRDRWTPFRAD